MAVRTPGVAYSITVRSEYPNDPGMLGKITSAIGDAGVARRRQRRGGEVYAAFKIQN